MIQISKWSGWRITLICAAWLVGAPIVAALGLALGGLVLGKVSGSTQIRLTANLTGWSVGSWLFAPPALFVAAWLVGRRRD